MQKRVFIIHGWGGYPEEGWLPWLKKELEGRGFIVGVPAMPDSENPRIEAWVPYLSELVGQPNENTYFIGHSIGCQTILRYLQTLPSGIKIGGAVFVAGWFNLENLEEEEKPVAKPWLETSIDFKSVKLVADKFVAILSDNDHYGAVSENQKTFEEKLGAKVLVEHKKGHFSGSDGITELPSALQSVLEIAGE